MKEQFVKTKLCPFFTRGNCLNGKDCTYAHSEDELRPLPNLQKTKLCERTTKGFICKNAGCTYAHSRFDLRPTHELVAYKTSLCFFHKKNRCLNGDKCRFAHGPEDLKPRDEEETPAVSASSSIEDSMSTAADTDVCCSDVSSKGSTPSSAARGARYSGANARGKTGRRREKTQAPGDAAARAVNTPKGKKASKKRRSSRGSAAARREAASLPTPVEDVGCDDDEGTEEEATLTDLIDASLSSSAAIDEADEVTFPKWVTATGSPCGSKLPSDVRTSTAASYPLGELTLGPAEPSRCSSSDFAAVYRSPKKSVTLGGLLRGHTLPENSAVATPPTSEKKFPGAFDRSISAVSTSCSLAADTPMSDVAPGRFGDIEDQSSTWWTRLMEGGQSHVPQRRFPQYPSHAPAALWTPPQRHLPQPAYYEE